MHDLFTIRQDLTFNEFLSSTLYYCFSGRLFKRFMLFLLGLTLLSSFLEYATTSREVQLGTFIYNFAPIFMIVPIVVVFSFFMCLYIYKRKPYLFNNVSYDFTLWGVVRHGEKTEFSKPWCDITKYKETKAFFLLYIGDRDFHIVQKRMLESSVRLDAFRQLLQENVKK